jgi:heptosyltransferase-3
MLVQGPGSCVPCQQQGCERHRTRRSDCLDPLEQVHVIAAAASMLDASRAPAMPQTSST